MASVIADMVEWLKRWFYTEDEVDTLLSSKQARLVSGSNIKTINNESLLGSGNIEIESGDSGGLVNVEDYYFDEESENLVLESDDEPFITTSWGNPTSDSLTPSEKLVKDSLDGKQATLVSGTNLKTINNESLLGSGNITIQGGSNVDVVTSWSSTTSNSKVPSEKLTKNTLDLKFENIPVTPTSATDIDTFKDFGFYTFFNNTAVASMTEENKAKLPTGLGNNSFYLLVEKKLNYVKQTLTKYSDGRTWIRIYNDSVNVQSWSAWKELVNDTDSRLTDDRNFIVTNVIPSSTDNPKKNLDDYLTQGFYTFFANADIQYMEMSNFPTGLGQSSFYLLVERKSNSYVKQTLTKFNDGRTWIRAKNSSVWSDWKELSMVGHTHLKTDITDFPSIPSKTSDLTNDGNDGTNVYVASNKITPTIETDIDTYKTVGLYTFFNDSAVASMTTENKAKLPNGLGNNSFYLLVEKRNNYAKQTLTKYSDGRTWIRIYNDNNNVQSWSAWQELSVVGHTHDDRYYTESEMDTALGGKQATLVSGTNLKTINNESLLGSGNITIQGGSNVDIVTSWESTLSDSKVASEKLVKNTLDTKIDDSILLEPTQENPIDLNDFTETGFYYQMDNTASAYVSHMPTEDNRAFSLLVEKQTGVKQTLTYYQYQTKPRTFIRELHWGGSTWFDWYEISFTEDLDSKQDLLVSGTNLKTINNESLLGSGNISISGGGGSVIGTGSFSINNNGHLIVELPNGVDNPYFINNNGHLVYDTSNTYNGE